ncbi:MAG: excinuclease ABC subunit UvrA [Phycisphaerales bacterium]|nr:MAG: excinuclease ABC subunit UvrA [Phycisphaerales bacterium]
MPDQQPIRIVGARQHNLKNITLEIPRDRLTVITGLSGSGKSSLAFDTIYAEGQRKYVESLSAYARQFLEQMQKPDVDRIEGSAPTIAIEQRSASMNPRSTVATVTEIYDYLRVLYARVAQPHCWVCRRRIGRQSTSQIVDAALALPAGRRILVMAPMVSGQRGAHSESLARMVKQGFVRARIDGEMVKLENAPPLAPQRKHTIQVVVDRLVVKEQAKARLADSIDLSLALANGRVIISSEDDGAAFHDHLYSSHFACPHHPDVNLPELSPRLFSFNSPHGACEGCNGLGTVLEFDSDLIVPDKDLSLSSGAIAAWRHGGKRLNAVYSAMLRGFCAAFGVSPDIPFRNIPAPLVDILMNGTDKARAREHGTSFEGVIPNLRRRWETTDSESVKHRMHGYLSEAPCETCRGARLRPEALCVTLQDRNIADVVSLTVADARAFFDALGFDGEAQVVADPILREIRQRLRFLCDVGVEYLSLNRGSATLSGGEAQRIRLATQIGSGLVGVCYVLDEPTIGLHQRDTQRLVGTLRRLAAMGNTVIVVEHDEECIGAADHVVDIGPGAGAQGGRIVAQGPLDTILACEESITAKYLTGRYAIPVPDERRPVDLKSAVEIRGARQNNLKNIDVKFPLGCFVCVTGVSGSGKSTLVTTTLLRVLHRAINGTGPRPGDLDRLVGAAQVDRVIQIDQSPIGRTPRSNPATYVGVFDLIRQLYARTREAKIRGYSPGRFSFNVRGGRCEECQGQGIKRIEMHFLPDVFVECGTCKGTRYARETLEVRYRGRNIADVLDMRVEEASRFFENFPKIKQLLRALQDVGLGYVTLGQSSTTLSGGEAQRVKLATELGKSPVGHTMYILDEPTTGLHFADIHKLLNVLNRLVGMGHTVLCIEHNLDVIKVADWVIDLGPDGGNAGGEVVVEGTPEQVSKCRGSHTGRFLRRRLDGQGRVIR